MFVAELSKNPGLAMTFSAQPNLPAGTTRPDDTLLVRRAQEGDTAAFEELVRHYDRTVLRLAQHLTDSTEDAQDIYQEAFLRAYRNIGRFRFECSFYTWIYRIVTNLCFDHLRRKQLEPRLQALMIPDLLLRERGDLGAAVSVDRHHTVGWAGPQKAAPL